MKVRLAAVGRMKRGPHAALMDLYKERLRWTVEVVEIDVGVHAESSVQQTREADGLLKAMVPMDKWIALDEKGETLSSIQLATTLSTWRESGFQKIGFVIGGADGLASSVVKQADLVLSMGRLTWPHMLVRGMLMEQLYRTAQIMQNHPYHRE